MILTKIIIFAAFKKQVTTMKLRSFLATAVLLAACTVNAVALTLLTYENLTENGFSEYDTEYVGYYAITNAEDLYAFADSVNSGQTYIDGVLTNDINLQNKYWTPIGTCETHYDGNYYNGSFDGRGHTVSNFTSGNNTTFFAGLFGGLEDAQISNLGVVNATITATKGAGAIAGGVISDYYNHYASITACWAINCTISVPDDDGNAGGILGGYWDSYNHVNQCFTYGVTTTADNSGSLLGYGYESVRSYALGKTESAQERTAEQFKNGEVCYLLNDPYSYSPTWYQTIGEDSLPTLDTTHGTVYRAYNCNAIYSNKMDSIAEHNFVDGVCRQCGQYDASPTLISEENYESLGLDESYIGYYALQTAGDLYWFANQYYDYDVVLLNDITINPNLLDENLELRDSYDYKILAWEPINSIGTFDGNNHTISGVYVKTDNEYTGFFQNVSGNITRLTIRDSYIKGKYYVGAIAGRFTGDALTYCNSEKCHVEGTTYVGGVVGNIYAYSSTTFAYCSNSSKVIGEGNVGGLIGYCETSEMQCCYNTGDVIGTYSVGTIYGQGYANIKSCFNYSSNQTTTSLIGSDSGNQTDSYCLVTDFDFYGKTKEQFLSGEVCYLLNGGNTENPVWHFTIGVDTIPTLDTTHAIVYVSEPCHQVYTNDKEAITKGHSFVHGICSICGAVESTPIIVTEENHEALGLDEGYIGYYAVKNAGELHWIANLVDGVGMEKGRANVVLIDDIVINKDVLSITNTLKEANTWYPIGFKEYYEGRFDGNGHTISGLYCNYKGNHQGLFGNSTGIITNLAIQDSYVNGGDLVGGICAYNGGTIANCSFNGVVVGKESVGGLVGENYGEMENCLHYGSVSGSAMVGGICGQNNNKVSKCLNIGNIYCHFYAGSISGNDLTSTGGEEPYGHKEDLTVTECYYDLELCLVGGMDGNDAAKSAEGKLTSALCSNIPSGFSSKIWGIKPAILEDGIKSYYYPYLKTFGENSAIFAVSRPTIFAKETLEVPTMEYGEVAPSFKLDNYFYSADGSKLTYSVTCESPLIDAYIYNDELFLTPYAKGSAVIAVTATMENGESLTQTVNLKIHSDMCTISLTANIKNQSCYGVADGSIELTADGGTEPYMFKWTTETRTDGNLYNLKEGQYTVIVLDSVGCSTIANYTISSPAEIDIYEDFYRPSCQSNNGYIYIYPTVDSENFIYKWNDGSNDSYIDELSAGTYTVVLTDTITGCSRTLTYDLNDRQGPNVRIDSVTKSNCNGATGAAYASSPDETVTFTWSNGATGAALTNVNAGEYYVTAEDQYGCRSVTVATVGYETVENPELAVVTVSEESGNNLIVWLREDTEWIDYYTIYRETNKTNVYDSIASVPYNEISVYVDEEADPGLRSWRYKLSATDICGNTSPLSAEQKTLHLAKNIGMNGEINLSWDAYEGVRYSTVAVYQITTTGTSLVAELPANLHSYTIYKKNVPSNIVSYVVGIVLPEEVDPTITYSKAESGPFSLAISNIAEVENTDPYDAVEEQTIQSARIYTIGHTIYVADANSNVVLYDVNGRVISQKEADENGNAEFSVAQSGAYVVQTTTTKQVVIVR